MSRPVAPSGGSLRARRWDVIVLGGALPGLVAAARLAMQGQRVLVVEEEAAARGHPGVREPFLLSGNASGGVLDACLRALTIPLIDRKKIEPDPIAFQVVLPDRRIDVGEPAQTVEELVTWALAKPDEAQDLVRALAEAGAAERAAMLDATIVRGGGLRGLARGAAAAAAGAAPRPARHGRGLPAEVGAAGPALAIVLEAVVRALSRLGELLPPPEARARLLASALEGGASYTALDGFLRSILRRRIQALFGEIRTVPGRFDLVTVGQQPGISAEGAFDVWVSRALVLNAPRSALASFLSEHGASPPEILDAPALARRRVTAWLRVSNAVLPEGMAKRVIRVRDPRAPLSGVNLATISVLPPQRGGDHHDVLVAADVAREADPEVVEAELEAIAREIMPFADESLVRERLPRARWDVDGPADPGPGDGWPGDVEIRLSSRPPIYGLSREGVAALGFEGDVLLGWRAGDAIRADLGD